MASNSKHTEWILETIDHLRRRKARPDLDRICHVVKRRFGLSAAETEAKLEKLVDAEIVIKVDYKGSTSYRNAAKWRKSMLGCAVLNSTTISIKIIEAILALSRIHVLDAAKKTGNGSGNPQDEDTEIKNKVREIATEVGVPLDSINAWLRAYCDGFDNLKSPLTVVLKREIDAGRVKRLLNCNYVITTAQMDEICDDIKPLKANRKPDTKLGLGEIGGIDQPGTSESSNSNEDTYSKMDLKVASLTQSDQRAGQSAPRPGVHQPARRGRPPKNRALMTQSQHPASCATPTVSVTAASSASSSAPHSQSKLKRILTSETGGPSSSDGPERKTVRKTESKKGAAVEEPKCDFCELTALCNTKGEPEVLLQCKDCTAKAHPSCMKYSRLLASRACRGPWQCMDCKTCCVCQDAGDPDQMLFCDGCDKGYHMNCHQPTIVKKPSGTWECSECKLENMALQRSEFMATEGNRHKLMSESAPPTPAESPVPSSHMNGDSPPPTSPCYQPGGRYPDASRWSVADVVEYLISAGFRQEAQVFHEQEIDGVALLLLKRADVLKGLDLKLGPALKINRHIQGLQTARKNIS